MSQINYFSLKFHIITKKLNLCIRAIDNKENFIWHLTQIDMLHSFLTQIEMHCCFQKEQ